MNPSAEGTGLRDAREGKRRGREGSEVSRFFRLKTSLFLALHRPGFLGASRVGYFHRDENGEGIRDVCVQWALGNVGGGGTLAEVYIYSKSWNERKGKRQTSHGPLLAVSFGAKSGLNDARDPFSEAVRGGSVYLFGFRNGFSSDGYISISF